MTAAISLVVPSLGQSPDQEAALESFRDQLAAIEGELVWVMQGSAEAPLLAAPRERMLRLAGPPGFAVAANAGLAATTGDLVALVNDDVVLGPGWLATLAQELAADPRLGAVQGAQLELARPDRVDGCGIAWNRRWEAVQVARGEAAAGLPRDSFELFGVSGTAALFRRRALAASALAGGAIFEPRLGSWYEDVELAARLRAAGWSARCVPSARALPPWLGDRRAAALRAPEAARAQPLAGRGAAARRTVSARAAAARGERPRWRGARPGARRAGGRGGDRGRRSRRAGAAAGLRAAWRAARRRAGARPLPSRLGGVNPAPAIATIIVSWRSRGELEQLLPALPRESWHETGRGRQR